MKRVTEDTKKARPFENGQRCRDAQDTQESEDLQDSEFSEIPRDRDTQETHDTHEASRSGNVFTIQQAVKLSLEDGYGDNSLFLFSRALKAFEKNNGTSVAKELESVFSYWWQKAGPYLGDSPNFDYHFDLFRITYNQTRVPLGKNSVDEAIELAKTSAVPLAAAEFTSEAHIRLVSVCYQLQRLAGNTPFFLSSRDAQRIVNMGSKTTGSVMLRGLVLRGILKLVEHGKKAGRRASRYTFNETAKP